MAAKTVINTLALWVLESAREGQGEWPCCHSGWG